MENTGVDTHLEFVIIFDSLGSTIVYGHRSLGETMVLLEGGIHEEYGFTGLCRAFLQRLLEEVTSPLNLGSTLRTNSISLRR